MHGFSYLSGRETDFNDRVNVKLQPGPESIKCSLYDTGKGSQCMLKGYIQNKYYKRSDTLSYHSCRKADFNAKIHIKL